MAHVKKQSGLFAYTNWDAIPVLAALLQAGFIASMFIYFHELPWWTLGVMGFVYAVSISWNINGVSHNFIHNPYFRSAFLNRAFSFLESVLCGFSQVFYDAVHRRHHMGNSDRKGENGDTVDWLSIYRHGHDDQPENVWSYTFLSYFRDNIVDTYAEVKRRSNVNAKWGIAEIVFVLGVAAAGFVLNWKFMLFLLPFYYLGHCLSSLNGYYKHYGANPDVPIAWGVSTYGKIYNLLWFNNGYHAEHHFRPRVHWTKMHELRDQIVEEQRKAGLRVSTLPHALGFIDPSLRDVKHEGRRPAPANSIIETKPLQHAGSREHHDQEPTNDPSI